MYHDYIGCVGARDEWRGVREIMELQRDRMATGEGSLHSGMENLWRDGGLTKSLWGDLWVTWGQRLQRVGGLPETRRDYEGTRGVTGVDKIHEKRSYGYRVRRDRSRR